MEAYTPHPWIVFGKDKKNIYGSSFQLPSIASYSILENLTLSLNDAVAATSDCRNKTSAFVLPMLRPPYSVFSGSWPGPGACGMTISVLKDGNLANVTQTWKYRNESAIHGLALSPSSNNLYSADYGSDAVWTHQVQSSGEVTERCRIPVLAIDSHPRHLTVHPKATYLYVVMESANQLVAYSLDIDMGCPTNKTTTYSLIPEGFDINKYWSAEVMLSASGHYLFATARAKPGTNHTGYISCCGLDDDGVIIKQIFMVPTTTSNGMPNSVAPAPFDDQLFALTDVGQGYVQVWKVGQAEGEDISTANLVAQVDIMDGGCCANAIWYD